MKNNKQLRDLLYEQEDLMPLRMEIIDHDDKVHFSPIYGIRVEDDEIIITGDWRHGQDDQTRTN